MAHFVVNSSENSSDDEGLWRRRGSVRLTHEQAPEVYVSAENNVLALNANEANFWINNMHDTFLRRLRSRRGSSFTRIFYLTFLALHVAYDDLRVWIRLYGPVGAVTVVILGKKSIWILQAEVLASLADDIRWRLSIPPVRSTREISRPTDNSDITAGRRPAGRPHSENEAQSNGTEQSPPGRQNPYSQNTADSPSYASTFEEARRGGIFSHHRSLDGRHMSPLEEPYDVSRGKQKGQANAPLPPPPQFSAAGLDFKKAVLDESARIGTSGGIITAVAMAALALPNVSQTHWVVQSCWTSSMVTAILAVYFSNNQTWTISQLSSEQKLRAWIKDIDPEDDYEAILQMNLRGEGMDDLSGLLDHLAPAPSSTITISAPSLLLSSSLLLRLSGMGVFLAFVWTRMLDTDAATSSSRDVFITYIVTLGASLGTVAFFSLGRVAVPIRQSIVRNLRRFGIDRREKGPKKHGDGNEILVRRRQPSNPDIGEIGGPSVTSLKGDEDDGYTPLILAAKHGEEAEVKQLLENGADLESKGNDGRAPLSWAAGSGYWKVVKLLLEKDADLESTDSNGRTPLSWAAGNGHGIVVELLLEKDADLESTDNNGRTPLSWAIERGCEAVVKQLFEKGASLESRDNDGRTPLSWAVQDGRAAAVKHVLERSDNLEFQNIFGHTPLSWAAGHGYEAVVKRLLENGANLEAAKKTGQTPLSRAAKLGRERVVKLLLENGADLESKDNNCRTPLSLAAQHGHDIVVSQLLEKGADLESKDKYGQTPLSRAEKHGHEAVVKQLLENGADLGSRNKKGKTSVLSAVQKEHGAAAGLILDEGINYAKSSEATYPQQTLLQDEILAKDMQDAVEGLSGEETNNKIQQMKRNTQDTKRKLQNENNGKIQEEDITLTDKDSQISLSLTISDIEYIYGPFGGRLSLSRESLQSYRSFDFFDPEFV